MQFNLSKPPAAWRPAAAWWRLNGWPTLRLAAPVMVARAGVVFIFFVASLMTGRAGADELAFLGQGLAAQSVMMLISIGLLQGAMILSAQAFGAREYLACGAIWKAGMLLAGGLGTAFALVCFLVEPFLLWTGTDTALAAGAGRVSLQFAWGLPAMLLYIVCGYFLESTRRPVVGMVIMLAANLVNIAACGIFVLGWGGIVAPLGAVGAGIATSGIRWLCLVAALVYIFTMRDGAQFGIKKPLIDIGPRIWRIAKLGAPISIALGLETAAMSSLAVMAGHLGSIVAAAYQLTFNLSGVLFMVAVGLSSATAIRVGHAVGRLDDPGVREAGFSGITLGIAIMTGCALLVMALPQTLSAAYVDDPMVWTISVVMLTAAGAMIVADGVMTVILGALRGMGDVRWPAFLHGGAFWLVGVPLAYLCAFVWGLGAVGLIVGITCAMVASLLLLGIRFVRISARAVLRA